MICKGSLHDFMRDLHDFAKFVIGSRALQNSTLLSATARVLTMFEIYRRNEEFLPGHAASDIP